MPTVDHFARRRRSSRALTLALLLLLLLGLSSVSAYTWQVETVDSAGYVGYDSSLALDANGYPHISYYDGTNGNLKYAHWNGSGWIIEIVDQSGEVGFEGSLALDSQGNPHISYAAGGLPGELRYAVKTASGWSVQVVDMDNRYVRHTSLALDAADIPHIAYQIESSFNLNYAYWDGTAWEKETVDTDDVGRYISLALDSTGAPRISYALRSDDSNFNLRYAERSATGWLIDTVDEAGNAGINTSLVIDSEGEPHISYEDFGNHLIEYATRNGTDWSIQLVESGTNFSSIQLDSAGDPHVAYINSSLQLRLASLGDTSWQYETVASLPDAGYTGQDISLALDTCGNPRISYLYGELVQPGEKPNPSVFRFELHYAQGGTCVIGNQPPIANPGGPYGPSAINAAIAFDGSGSADPDGVDLTSYSWSFGDDSTSSEAAPSHAYAAPGIYDVCLTVSDSELESAASCTMAVVYDPSGGFVTGGGSILSAAGAYLPDETLTGPATFGFISRYKKGATVPTGDTSFAFEIAGLSFISDSYEWLVLNQTSKTAQFKGTGTIDGEPYRFMLWAADGAPDTFRIKIWQENGSDETVVYDNGTAQAIVSGNVVIHIPKGK